MDNQPKWPSLPTRLSMLPAYADKYGNIYGDDAVVDFFRNLTEAELFEFRAANDFFFDNWEFIQSWIKENLLEDSEESTLVMYSTSLFAEANDRKLFQ